MKGSMLLVAVLLAGTWVGTASATSPVTRRASPVPPPPIPCDYLRTPPVTAVFGTTKDVGTPPEPRAGLTSGLMAIETNRGPMRISLLPDAPCTVNSFQFLASKRYFDGSHCHRLTTSGSATQDLYVLQCGDPFGTGDGGPGYVYRDENLVGATYDAGTVAMANAGPYTNGSQFFIVYGKSRLGPHYTPFGRVDAATLKLVKRIAAGGTDNGPDGHPRISVVFRSLRVALH